MAQAVSALRNIKISDAVHLQLADVTAASKQPCLSDDEFRLLQGRLRTELRSLQCIEEVIS